MKLLKLIPVLFIITLYNTNSFAETQKDCSSIKADTGVKMYEKLKWKMGKENGDGLGKKLKNLFKKKANHWAQ